MKKYIFFTDEGTTLSPNGDEMENFQIIAFEEGINMEEAKINLRENNPWIEKAGFDMDKIQVKELA